MTLNKPSKTDCKHTTAGKAADATSTDEGKTDNKGGCDVVYRVTVVLKSQNCDVYVGSALPTLRKLVRQSEKKFQETLFDSISGFVRHDEKTGVEPQKMENDRILWTALKQTKTLTLHAVERCAETSLLGDALIEKREKDALALMSAGVDPWQRCMRVYPTRNLYGAAAVHFAAAAGLIDFVQYMIEKFGAKLSTTDYNRKTLAQYCDDGKLFMDANFMQWLTKYASGTRGLCAVVTLRPQRISSKENKNNVDGEEKFLETSEIGRRLLCMVRGNQPLPGKIPISMGQTVLVLNTQRFARVSRLPVMNALPYNAQDNQYWIRPYNCLPFTELAQQPEPIDPKCIVPYPFPVTTNRENQYAPTGNCRWSLIETLVTVCVLLGALLIAWRFKATDQPVPSAQIAKCFASVERCDQRVFSGQKMVLLQWQIEHQHELYDDSTDRTVHLQWQYRDLNMSDCVNAAYWVHHTCGNTMHEIVTTLWIPAESPLPVLTMVPDYAKRHPSVDGLRVDAPPEIELREKLFPHLRDQMKLPHANFTFPSEYQNHNHPPRAIRTTILKLVTTISDLQRYFVVLTNSDIAYRYDIRNLDLHEQTPSLETCATACRLNYKCTAVTYNHLTRDCWLKSHPSSPTPETVFKPNITLALLKTSTLPFSFHI